MKRVLVLLSAVLLLAAIALTGCSSSSGGKKLTAADVLGKSYDAMQAVKAFHFTLEHSTGGTPIGSGVTMTKAEGDLVRPDKLSAKLAGSAMGMTANISLVTVGAQTMMTNPLSGKWEAAPDSFKVLTVFDPGKGIAAIVKGLTGAAFLTEEKLGDVLCYHIKGDIATPALAPLTGTTAKDGTVPTEVWISKDAFLVQQVKLNGKITDTEASGILRTLSFTNYNKEVDIKLPA